MAKGLNIVIGADVDKLKKGLADAVTAIQESGAKMSAETAKAAKEIQNKLGDIATKNPTAGTVRQLTNLAMQTRALGPEFADMANQIIREAGRIKDSIGDARAEIDYFASDTRRIDAALGGVEAVAGAFGAVEGALALTGIESDDLQKTMVKLQGAIALVNGVQAIQNALQAESAVRMGITTAATKIYTFATGTATGATLAFRTALMSLGIGVVVAGIAALAANFGKIKDALFPADAALKSFNKTLDASIAKNQNDLKILEAKGDKLGSFAKQEEILNQTLAKARQNFGKNNNENWGKIIDDTKTALAVLRIERQNYNAQEKKKQDDHNAELIQQQQNYHNKLRAQKQAQLQKELDDALQAIRDRAKGEADAHDFMVAYYKRAEEKKQEIVKKSKELTAANLIAGTAQAPILLQVKIDPQSYSQIVQEFDALMKNITSAVEQLGEDVSIAFGEAIGGALSGQGDVMRNLGNAIISAMAQFLSKVGKMLIAYAISIEKLKTAFASPEQALAAGIALVAIGAAVTATMKKGPNVTAFADGGIVSGPTLGLMGEYPGASTNPEVIAPLDKLRSLIKPSNDTGYIASTQIQGRDLAIVLERYNRDSKRG